MKLLAIIEQDATGFYFAEIPALPGCVSQGKTIAEAKANIKEAIAGWTVDRQVGSHVMLVKSDYPYTLSIPQRNTN